jgi:ribonuclease HI
MEQFRDGGHPTLVFCDGACSGNPGRGGWASIIVTPDGDVRELGGGSDETTNNRMEMAAAISALESLQGVPGAVEIWTDSVYVIRGITQWVWGWRKREWKTAEGSDVLNRDLWEVFVRVVASRPKEDPIRWRYVRGHAGVPGNERVDEIAVAFSKGQRPKLYRGPLLKYDVAVTDLPESGELPEMKPKGEKKAAAYSYLSLVDGRVTRHATWPECERLVKGRSGAKFKKAMSEAEEAEILAGWGVTL